MGGLHKSPTDTAPGPQSQAGCLSFSERCSTRTLSRAPSVLESQESSRCEHCTGWASRTRSFTERQELRSFRPQKTRMSYKIQRTFQRYQRPVSNPKVPAAPGAPAPAQTWLPGAGLREGRQPAAYLSVSCHDQRSGSSGLRFAARHGQGGG